MSARDGCEIGNQRTGAFTTTKTGLAACVRRVIVYHVSSAIAALDLLAIGAPIT